jgi:hypothetical protein
MHEVVGMLRRLNNFALVLALALPALAVDQRGAISGYVRSAAGTPQMGAVVEVLGSAANALEVFTDEKGFYSAADLLPGVYNIKVSAPSFLPALREHVGLRAGGSISANFTLSTLFEVIRFSPTRGPVEQDDWKWVLRSASNRPILRMVDDDTPPLVLMSEKSGSDRDLKGTLSFLAGSPSEGFGSASDVSTDFSMEKSIFAADSIGLRGDLGYGTNSPTAILRASFSHKMADGSQPEIDLTMRSLPAPDIDTHITALQAFALTTSDSFTMGNLDLRFGSELQTIQFMGRVTAFRPFGSADYHFSPNTMLEYSYATSEPYDRMDKGLDAGSDDLSASGPHVSMVGYTPALEHAHHHELSISHRMGDTSLQFAVYADQVIDPALTGIGEYSSDGGFVLPDVYSGSFTYQPNDLHTQGFRVVAEHKLTSNITGTLDIASGGVIDLSTPGASLQSAVQSTVVRNRHSAAGKISGTLPKTKTHWVASYRWINGEALTPVDLFNNSAGQAAPYLNIFFRQPIPGTSFLPVHMEIMMEVRNLLAQGYVPVLGSDGQTVYLVQSARAVRGGLAFTF